LSAAGRRASIVDGVRHVWRLGELLRRLGELSLCAHSFLPARLADHGGLELSSKIAVGRRAGFARSITVRTRDRARIDETYRRLDFLSLAGRIEIL